MTGLTATVDSRTALQALSGLANAGQRARAALFEVAEEVKTLVDLTFRASADPYGRPWAPLKPSTLKRRRGRGGQILVDNGLLSRSIQSGASDTEAIVHTNVPYATTHQYGAKRGEFGSAKRQGRLRARYFFIPFGDIPARPFFPIVNDRVQLPPDAQTSVLDILSAHLLRGART